MGIFQAWGKNLNVFFILFFANFTDDGFYITQSGNIQIKILVYAT